VETSPQHSTKHLQRQLIGTLKQVDHLALEFRTNLDSIMRPCSKQKQKQNKQTKKKKNKEQKTKQKKTLIFTWLGFKFNFSE
jgi:hypothetical protein